MAGTGSLVRVEVVRERGQRLEGVARRVGARFARGEARDRARPSLVGLLAPVQRESSRQLAEQIGEDAPYGVQHLPGRSGRDPDEVRDDLRAHAVESLGDPEAVLALDEAGSLKQGTRPAGVARRYAGTAGRIENAQVGVFLAHASRHGAASLDRASYPPAERTGDPGRCQKAGLPEGTASATKTDLAKEMLARAFEAGVPASWVTGGEAYGGDGDLRRWPEGEGRPYALAARADRYARKGSRQAEVAAPVGSLPRRAWHRITIACGSEGPRRYARAWPPVDHDPGTKWQRWLLVRRSPAGGEELASHPAASGPASSPGIEAARRARS